MRPIKLEEIVPQAATITLKKTERTYRLRPIDVDDELWLQTRFGNRLQEILSQIRMPEICEIVFHQMEDEDQELFRAQDVKVIDGAGEEHTLRLGGAKLLSKLISGYVEKIAVYQALMVTIGISRPLLDELASAASSTEKKSDLTSQPTGDGSSTPSHASTDGPSEKSEGSP